MTIDRSSTLFRALSDAIAEDEAEREYDHLMDALEDEKLGLLDRVMSREDVLVVASSPDVPQ